MAASRANATARRVDDLRPGRRRCARGGGEAARLGSYDGTAKANGEFVVETFRKYQSNQFQFSNAQGGAPAGRGRAGAMSASSPRTLRLRCTSSPR